MTNSEKSKEKLDEILVASMAVDKESGAIRYCNILPCDRCLFCDEDGSNEGCAERIKEWLNTEYQPFVDWSKVVIDTPILVSDDKEHWHRRYFSKYEKENKTYPICTYANGTTSWSHHNVTCWKYAKLAESDENVNG